MLNAVPYLLLAVAIAAPIAAILFGSNRPSSRVAVRRRYRSLAARRRDRREEDRPSMPSSTPRQVLAASGVSLLLVSVAFGLLVLDVEDADLPEPRGIGVVPSVTPAAGRGLAVSAAVDVHSCGRPVKVTLVVSGSAEYWADHARDMRRQAGVRVAIPGHGIRNVEIGLGGDGKLSPIAPSTQQPDPDRRLSATRQRELRTVTVLGARVEEWGRHLRPVVFRFDADWLDRRDLLGTCYLRMPALTGDTTVLSAQELRGDAHEDLSKVECPCSALELVSEETGLQAFYLPQYETTRGLVTTDIGKSRVRGDLSLPPPDGNVRGKPSWTCSSKPPQDYEILERVDTDDVPDLVLGADETATGAVSVRRLGTTVTERNCGSFAVIEEASAQLRRDFAVLLLGVLFSTGIALIVEYGRSRRRA